MGYNTEIIILLKYRIWEIFCGYLILQILRFRKNYIYTKKFIWFTPYFDRFVKFYTRKMYPIYDSSSNQVLKGAIICGSFLTFLAMLLYFHFSKQFCPHFCWLNQ